jgi:hypothetical protein
MDEVLDGGGREGIIALLLSTFFIGVKLLWI